MKPFRRALPSLNALMSFEAAARHGSFTAAARELGVTQAAVSRQVQLLEEDFGVLLFRRAHRKVELTAAGTLLAGTLNACFDRIRDTTELIRQPLPEDTLTVGATVAFSHYWLLPRIAEFRAANPTVTLRIVTQDAPFDLIADDVDVVVRYGSGTPRGGEVLASVADVVYPVAAPALRDRLPAAADLDRLRSCPLLGSDAPDRTWITWPAFFEAAGVKTVGLRPALHFSSYTDCIQAAVAGQGVALGWDFLLARLIETGQLMRVSDRAVRPEGGYQLIVAARRRTEAAAAFVAWAERAFTRRSG